MQQYTQSHAASMNWPILSAVKPTPTLVQVALDRPVCVVGARARVSLPLSSSHVSRTHALIIHDAGGVYVRDLASLNKTFVNKRAVRETWLLDRDIVQFGTEAFVCRSGFGQPSQRELAPLAELWLTASGGASMEVMALGQETFLIGSRGGCDLLLDAADVASAHAVIFVRDGRRYLRNLSPLGNTSVDGRAGREVELHGEEQVLIAGNRLEFHVIEPNVTLSDGTAAVHEDGEDDDSGEDELILPWEEAVEEANAAGSVRG
ncbi:MAG TPA: FHA domain-containing protein [Humisphaera sp.]|nr:FHA domain-containing protein [Humisphaera sp.]